MINEEVAFGAKILPGKYEEIERVVAKLYEEQRIHSLPINPFDIIKNRGYLLVPFSRFEKGTCPECVNENNDAFSFYYPQIKTYIIVYNDDKPLRRIRFTLMHEIGHIDLGHKGESELARKMADYYAAYALAPSPLIGEFASEERADIVATFEVSLDCADRCSKRYLNWQQYSGRYLKDYEIEMISLFR